MELVVSITASIQAFFASVLGNLLAHDICVSADRTCSKIIRNAASRLAAFDRESRESEWLADLHERETVREKYQHAIGCFLVAGNMRRRAEAVMLVLSFGAVPLTLKLNSRVLKPLFLKAATAKSKQISEAAIVLGILYLTFKLRRSAKASRSSGASKLTRDHWNQSMMRGYYEAHLKWGRIDVDLVEAYRLFRLFMDLSPERILELATQLDSIPSLAKLLKLAAKLRESIPSLDQPQSVPSETLGATAL
jgi:hypothetical protein